MVLPMVGHLVQTQPQLPGLQRQHLLRPQLIQAFHGVSLSLFHSSPGSTPPLGDLIGE
jgi:hypothetical protein